MWMGEIKTYANKGADDYNAIFLEAWKNVLQGYRNAEIMFLSERDLQGHLFSESLKLMRAQNFPTPYKVYAERSILSKRKKTDLVLGEDDIAVEMKLEPDYPGVSKPVAFREAVEKDIKSLDEYIKRGVKHAHFVMIDEDGDHARNPRIKEKWETIHSRGRRCYCIHIQR